MQVAIFTRRSRLEIFYAATLPLQVGGGEGDTPRPASPRREHHREDEEGAHHRPRLSGWLTKKPLVFLIQIWVWVAPRDLILCWMLGQHPYPSFPGGSQGLLTHLPCLACHMRPALDMALDASSILYRQCRVYG